MNIQPQHLLALAYVARTGSLTRAAHQLGRTQPALSTQLQRLAETVGEPLISRHRYGMTLTAAGKALLPAAEAMARSLDAAAGITDALRGVKQGPLRVFTSTSVAVYLLPRVLAVFHERYPGIEFQLRHRTPDEAMHALGRNEADLAVMRAPMGAVPAGFVKSLLETDETVLAVSPDHELADRGELDACDLDGLEIVSRADPSPTRQLVDLVAENAGASLRVKFEVSAIEALKEAILQGFGGGFLSRLAVARDVEAGRLVPLSVRDPAMLRQIFLVHPVMTQLTPRIEAFLDVLYEVKLPESPTTP